ncbi:MAG: hypothetical protein EZS28_006515 [Streblomastix strix]|uniref:TmcB/TmcC TPR repeats domain-containing protein n=1 Tax=Streblomastix strix TaxID=222440 RepID=A0A5J4WTS3_9EUKA|nr:MAG: hypothetical protein EZS28_006515 [Streblomastix strix]
MKRIGENQLGALCLLVAASGGIVSLILTPLNALSSMNSVGLKKFANILFYISIIVIITTFAFAGQTLVGRIGENLWVIRPVTVLRETYLLNAADMNKEVFNMKKKLIVEQQITNSNIAKIPGSYSGSASQQLSLQQADNQYEISKAHLIRFWSLLTRRSVDVDNVQHHILLTSQNARLAQEQYNTLLIVDSENPNTVRQYSILMIDLNGEDRLGIDMF